MTSLFIFSLALFTICFFSTYDIFKYAGWEIIFYAHLFMLLLIEFFYITFVPKIY